MKVFVYGTLKRNCYFHESYLGGNKGTFLSTAHTGPGYSLYVDGLPHMVTDRDGIGVKGEIYEVDGETLKSLDELEGHPIHYRRELISVKDHEGNAVKCWSYLRPKHLFENRNGVSIEEEFL